jgi:DNA-binding CsgD family transcriptional regulator
MSPGTPNDGTPARTPPPRPARPSLEEIVKSAPALVFLLNPEGRYLYLSARANKRSSEVEEGKLLEEVLPPLQSAYYRALMARVEATRAASSVEFEASYPTGRRQRFVVTLSPFINQGRVQGFIGVRVASPSESAPADAGAAELASRLTPKQREVLVLVAEGLSSREIGERLGVSERTVETHREQLMDRLDIRGVAALARFALSAGLL